MKKIILTLILVNLNLLNSFSQEVQNTKDSIFLLNIEAEYKLNVLEFYSENFWTPEYNIDFPMTNYKSSTKSLKFFSAYDQFSIEDSSIALIRVEYWAHESFGNGGWGKLIQLSKKSSNIYLNNYIGLDKSIPIIRIDSVTENGIFHLTIENQHKQINIGEKYDFETNFKKKTEDHLLDFITVYSIKNEGLISRKIER